MNRLPETLNMHPEMLNETVDYNDGDLLIFTQITQLVDTRPLRPDLNFLILCWKGQLRFDLNGNTMLLQKGDIVFSPAGAELTNYRLSEDCDCKVLCLSDRIIRRLLYDKIQIWTIAVYMRGRRVVRLPDEDREQFERYYALLLTKLRQKPRAFQTDIIYTLTRAILLELSGILHEPAPTPEPDQHLHAAEVMTSFLTLLSRAEVKRHNVAYYATALAVTPKYLTAVSRRYTGRTALRWIEQYVNDDIVRLLKTSDESFKEISHRLGFPNNSFFGSYIRKHFNMTPNQLRAKLWRSNLESPHALASLKI